MLKNINVCWCSFIPRSLFWHREHLGLCEHSNCAGIVQEQINWAEAAYSGWSQLARIASRQQFVCIANTCYDMTRACASWARLLLLRCLAAVVCLLSIHIKTLFTMRSLDPRSNWTSCSYSEHWYMMHRAAMNASAQTECLMIHF